MEEKPEYYYRLTHLVLDVGTEVLLNVFKSKTGPSIKTFLRNKEYEIKGLAERELLDGVHLELLNQTSFDETKLDISLLYTLLRYLTDIQAPNNGWDAFPLSSDKSPGACLKRLKDVRNEVYTVKLPLVKSEFDKLWDKTSKILVELAGAISTDEKLAVEQRVKEVKDQHFFEDKIGAPLKLEFEETCSELESKLDASNDKISQQGCVTEEMTSFLLAIEDQMKKLGIEDSSTGTSLLVKQSPSTSVGQEQDIQAGQLKDIIEQSQRQLNQFISQRTLIQLPPEIIRMDSRSKELYIKALSDGKTNVHSIRVMVVGHLGVGKTTLTKRLFGEPVNIEERNSTDGIDVHIKRCWVSLETGAWEVEAKGLRRDDSTARLAQVFQKQISERSVQSGLDRSLLEKSHDARFQEQPCLKSDDSERSGNANLDATETAYDESDPVGMDKEPAILPSGGSQGRSLDQVAEELKLLVQESRSEHARDMSKFADLSIWDFAGQYAFYGTHQIFLSGRAVYLLVIDMSKQIDSLVTDDECMGNADGRNKMKISEFVKFWLKSIYFYTKEENTVILVGTHVDKLKEEGRLREVEQIFEQLREDLSGQSFSLCLSDREFAIDNNLVDENLEGLKKAILEVAQSKKKYWGEAIPAKFLTFERELLKRKDDKIMEIHEVGKLNQNMSVPLDTKEFDLFLRFQHKCGLLLYFSEEGLKDYVVLDPQWLINAFKCFITTEKFMRKNARLRPLWHKFNKTGILTQEFIDQSWKHSEDQPFYKHKDHLLRLMEKLDIIARPMLFEDEASSYPNHPIAVSNSDYFMPCMFKDQAQKTHLDTSQKENSTSTSKLCYTFCPVFGSGSERSSGFVPPAIFHRLLATCMGKWQPWEQNKRPLLFRDCGVFYLDPPSRLHQLTLYLFDNFIQIWVTRISKNGKKPAQSECTLVRKYVEGFLNKVCDITACSCDDIRTFIKCSQADVFTSEGMIDITGMEHKELEEEFLCTEHNEEHVVNLLKMYSWWFDIEGGGIHELQDQDLDRLLGDTDIEAMSQRIGFKWKQIGIQLGLSTSKLEHIEMDKKTAEEKISAMLHSWKNKKGTHATFGELKNALVSSDVDVDMILYG